MADRRPRVLIVAPDVQLALPAALAAHMTGDYVTVWRRPVGATLAGDLAKIARWFGEFGFAYQLPVRAPVPVRVAVEVARYVRMGLALARAAGPYDAIVCYSPYQTALAGLILRRLTGAKVIVEYPSGPTRSSLISPTWLARLKHRVAPRLARWIARRADRVVVLFPGQAESLGLPATTPCSLVHPFTHVGAPPSVPRERFLLTVGRPYFWKGADLLVRAFRAVAPDFPDWRLVLAGSDEDPAPLRALAADAPVEFLGRIDEHADLMRLFASAGAFVLPSRSEGLPRVLIQAMATGAPVIASAVDGIPYLLDHGAAGRLVPPDDWRALAEGLRAVMGDPATARRLGEAGRARVAAGFTEPHVAEMWRRAVAATVGTPGA